MDVSEKVAVTSKEDSLWYELDEMLVSQKGEDKLKFMECWLSCYSFSIRNNQSKDAETRNLDALKYANDVLGMALKSQN